ncbi:epi-1, partial [Symbiodinium necroappetens]
AARTEKEAINQAKEAAEQRLAELTDRFATERAKLEDSMREEKKKAESAAENMQAQLKTADAANTKSKEELEKAKSHLEDLQDKLQILQAERDELSKKLEGAIPKSSLPTGCKDVADLVRQRTASREEAAAERLAREQYQQALEKVEKAIQHRLPILVSQKQEIGRFKSRAALLTKQNEDLLARVKELEAQKNDSEARATKAADSKKLVEDYARDAAHQLAVLLHENRKLTGSLPASEVTMEAREENRRAFRTVQELVDQNLSMKNSISQLLRESQEERKEMQLANEREKQLDKKLKDQEEKYTGLFEEQKAQIRKIEEERDRAQSEAKETTKQREAEAEARKVQIEAEQKTLSDERSKNELLSKARESLEKEMKEKDQRAEEAAKKAQEELDKEKKQKEQQAQEAGTQQSELNKKVTQLEATLQEERGKVQSLTKARDDLAKEAKEQEKRAKQSEGLKALHTKKIDELTAKLDAEKKQLEDERSKTQAMAKAQEDSAKEAKDKGSQHSELQKKFTQLEATLQEERGKTQAITKVRDNMELQAKEQERKLQANDTLKQLQMKRVDKLEEEKKLLTEQVAKLKAELATRAPEDQKELTKVQRQADLAIHLSMEYRK